MHTQKLKSKLTPLALVSAALLAFTSCSTAPEGTGEAAVLETPDGAAVIETVTVTATVTGIDAATRKVTFVTPQGHHSTFKAGPEVINFDQIHIGDQIRATLTEEFVVSLRPGGAPASIGSLTGIALAPKGAKPGMVLTDAEEVTATVQSIDAKRRQVQFQFADGTTKNLKVGKRADLASVKPGDAVTVGVAQSLAIVVVKP
jgi:hypothetical protein